MGNDPTETKQEESVWQVQLGDAGCMMTRRELDAALAREDIDPYTLVREPGTLRWLSLGTVRGIDSETMSLTSNDVEIVPSDYKPSFVAPRPVPIETERERPPEELTPKERALVRPRMSFLPRLVLVGAATFAGVFLAQHYLPSLSSYVRAHASAAATQASVAASQASVASIAPPASAKPPPVTSNVASTTTPPAPASVVARPAPAPSSPPEARVLLAAKPRAQTPARTASARPSSPTAKKAAPATTRSSTTAKAKPATPKAAPKPASKPAATKPASTTSAKPAPQPMKPDPTRPSRAR